MSAIFKDRTGEIGYNTYRSKMTIIKYNNSHDIVVEFENGCVSKTRYDHFREGKVTNPFDKSVSGIGYIGEGGHKVSENNKAFLSYHSWRNMIIRCYNLEYQERRPTYKGCSVNSKWHSYQNFMDWYIDNYYEIEGCRMDLDKDILVKGNKEYSEDTCCFVPQFINSIFLKCDKSRGNLPIGVRYCKGNGRDKQYASYCMDGKGTQKFLGYYPTPEEAFYAYKQAKENYIKEVAEKYKSQIPEKLYNALMIYQVEITD